MDAPTTPRRCHHPPGLRSFISGSLEGIRYQISVMSRRSNDGGASVYHIQSTQVLVTNYIYELDLRSGHMFRGLGLKTCYYL